jgi:hypothetical protein
VALREEHRLRVFETNVWTRKDKVIGGWRKLTNEELHNLCFSSSIIRITKLRRMRWARHVSWKGEKRNVHRLLVKKPEGKRPLRSTRPRWVDNIKMNIGEIGCGGMDWISLAQDMDQWRALVNAVMNLQVP